MIEHLLRSIPPFKGKQRIARVLLHSRLQSGTNIEVSGKHGCHYTLPNVRESIGFEILINGIYEAETIAFICARMKVGGTFLDIGANIGAISIPVKKLRSDVEVVCIEAAPWIYDYLKLNVEHNKITNIQLFNKAISDSGEKQVDFFSPFDKFGKGSLAPVFTDTPVKVSTITLDELDVVYKKKPIEFIKVDVEGFESLAFKGGSRLLNSQSAPDILFEFVDWAEKLSGEDTGTAQKILLTYGYRLCFFENGKVGSLLKTPVISGSHMIFATKEKNR